ncbi:MAG TPA: NADH-quinone oxidoreductase subunit C [Opitutales bacterium]|nr:NADH-quinone oxidoreductase subunit C [Opitutales bacterium]
METILETLKAKFPFVTPRPSSDTPAVNVPADKLLEFGQALRDELGYDMLLDLCGVDWDKASPRFGVVYQFYHSAKKVYLRVATLAPDNAAPAVPSLASLWPSADWHEREAYDMVGIRFDGHPNLKRILMWDSYQYFPLRKEFPLAGIESELPAADTAAATQAKVIAAPMMGGPFHAATQEHHHLSEDEPRAADESWTENRPKPGQKG